MDRTKATVKNYWIPIDDSPDGDFNNLETNEFDPNDFKNLFKNTHDVI